MMKYCLLLAGTVLSLTACTVHHEDGIAGDWVQPIPGQKGNQGIRLSPGGKASSINMHTLVYSGWERAGDKLVLKVRSIGNHASFEITETCTIKTLTKDRLVLEIDGRTESYTKST